MDSTKHLQSLAAEISATKDRVQNLIGRAHWPSVGSWKESVLRTVLRRYLPASMHIGTGFVMSRGQLSKQIDVLIYDDSGPMLFRDGDFVVVTPEVVRAVIEVKTHLRRREIPDIIASLEQVGQLVATRAEGEDEIEHQIIAAARPHPFLGLFCYEDSNISDELLEERLVASNLGPAPVNCISLDADNFVRFWPTAPNGGLQAPYNRWHFYDLPELSLGYFVHNVVDHLFPSQVSSHLDVWYPTAGKEAQCRKTVRKNSRV